MPSSPFSHLPPETADFYRRMLHVLHEAEVPFLVGGAHAFACYTGIVRDTKDLDLFVRPKDVDRTLEALAEAGCRTAVRYPHWLARAQIEGNYIDVIYRSGNGVSEVDDSWIEAGVEHEILGVPVRLCAPEEIIWSKAYVMERERYDGADVAHLLLCCADEMDWSRLIERFAEHGRLLLSYLILFQFIYPSEQGRIPRGVMQRLLRRLEDEPSAERVCRGTLISRAQYRVDVERWGYDDARLPPHGQMTDDQIAYWTDAIEKENRPPPP